MLTGAGKSGASGPSLPAAPTNVVVTQSGADLAITWTAAAGATSYDLYRSTFPGTETLLTAGVTSGVVDSDVDFGTTYYYKVAAVNGVGSTLSSEASGTPAIVALSPALWLKSDGLEYQDAARTIPATADSDPVGGETDYSTNANHPTQSTSGLRNLFRTNRLNSLPALAGDGTRGASNLGTPIVLSGDFSVFFVIKPVYAGAADGALMGKASGGKYFGDFFQGNIYFVPDSGSGVQTDATSYASGTTSFFEFRRTGSTLTFYRDRIQIGSALTTSDTFTINQIGGFSGASSAWSGDRYEAVICTSYVSTANAIALWKNLGDKWAWSAYPTTTTRTLIGQGDSNMAGIGGAVSGFDSMSLSQTTVRTNIGIAGQWVSAHLGGGMLAAEKTAVFPLIAPNAPWCGMVIMGGTNDLSGGTTPATIFAAIQSCVNDFLAACTAKGVTGKVLVRPIPNFTPTYADPADQQTLNGLIKAAYVDATVAGVYSYDPASIPLVTALNAYLSGTYFQGDGLHLTTAGQNIYGAADAAVINAWG